VAVDVLPSRFHTILIASGQMQFVFFVGVVVRSVRLSTADARRGAAHRHQHSEAAGAVNAAAVLDASDQRGRLHRTGVLSPPSPNGRPFTFAFMGALFTSTSVAVDVLPSRFHTILIASGQMQFVFFVGVVVRGKCIGRRGT
jgi:hypothetical protein